MVTEWGMSDLLGPVLYAENSEEVFLGKSVTQNKNMSEETARVVDAEIKRLVCEAHEGALNILKEKKEDWERLSEARQTDPCFRPRTVVFAGDGRGRGGQ